MTARTLRADIRRIVDGAERRMSAPEIYEALERPATPQVFGVTLVQMVDSKQLRKRKAPKSQRSVGNVRFVYGPGPEPVSEERNHEPRISPRKGFMQIARERRAKQRATRRTAIAAGRGEYDL